MVPQHPGRAAQGRSSEGAASYVMLLLFLVVYYSVGGHGVWPGLRPFRLALVISFGSLGFLLVEKTLSGRPFHLCWPEGHALVAFFGAAAMSIPGAMWPRSTAPDP